MSEEKSEYENGSPEASDAMATLMQIAEKVLDTAPSTIAMLRQTPEHLGRLEEELAELESRRAEYIHKAVEAAQEDLEITLVDAAFMAGDEVLNGKNAETRKIQMDHYLANHVEVNKAKRALSLFEQELIRQEARIGYVKSQLIEQRETMRGAIAAASLQASMGNLLSSLLASGRVPLPSEPKSNAEDVSF